MEGFTSGIRIIAGVHEQAEPPTYKTTNGRSYNRALWRRGAPTIWFDPAMSWEATRHRGRGISPFGEKGAPASTRFAQQGRQHL